LLDCAANTLCEWGLGNYPGYYVWRFHWVLAQSA
jgi:hypothetical protein